MIVKKTKQLGNFKKGINLYVPRRSSGRPSGIPTATTTIVNINAISSLGFEGYFYKLEAGYWYGPEDYALGFVGVEWQVIYNGDPISFNTGQTVNFIPQTNWSVPITITVVA
jgi:hypothetical protein